MCNSLSHTFAVHTVEKTFMQMTMITRHMWMKWMDSNCIVTSRLYSNLITYCSTWSCIKFYFKISTCEVFIQLPWSIRCVKRHWNQRVFRIWILVLWYCQSFKWALWSETRNLVTQVPPHFHPSYSTISTLKPRYNESLYNEFPYLRNKITKTKLGPWQKNR